MRYEVTLRLSVEVVDGQELHQAALRALASTHHGLPDDAFASEAVGDEPGALATLLGGAMAYQALASCLEATGSSLVGVYAERGHETLGG